jgi:hypothetical protein
MADSERSGAATRGQLPRKDALGQAQSRLAGALDSIQTNADRLRGLADTLEQSAGVSCCAPEQVPSAAASARAVATQIQLAALSLAESGERLLSWQDAAQLPAPDD